MRSEHKLIATTFMTLSAVVLHHSADRGAFRVPDGETAAELARRVADDVNDGAAVVSREFLALDALGGKRRNRDKGPKKDDIWEKYANNINSFPP